MILDTMAQSSKDQEFSDIQITVRIRECPEDKNPNISKVQHNPQMFKIQNEFFTFDNIKWKNESQERFYETVAHPFVEKALQGQNATILAYGPTGAGKSYTMGSLLSMISNWQDRGIIQRCLKQVFEESEIQVSASIIEIYSGETHDLLNMGAIMERDVILNPKIQAVKSLEDGLQLVNKALSITQGQQTSISSMHSISSSRSHVLLIFHLKIKKGNKFLESKLSLVDLAGSRIVSSKANKHGVFDEESYLNESLSALNRVINVMSKKIDSMPTNNNNILGFVLKDLFTAKCLISLIACISSDPASDSGATFRTLRVAESLKTVQIRQRMGIILGLSDTEDKELKTEEVSIDSLIQPQKIELSDTQDEELAIPAHTKKLMKNCMVVLNKVDVDFHLKKNNLGFIEDTSLCTCNTTDMQNEKIPSKNIEVEYSAATASTLSISRQTENSGQETYIKTELDTSEYDKFLTSFNDSFSIGSSLEDAVTVTTFEKLHTNNDEISDNEEAQHSCSFDDPRELLEMLQPSDHEAAQVQQSEDSNNIEQSYLSRLIAECSHELRGPLVSEIQTGNYQLIEEKEIHSSGSTSNKMKRMNAILTTDFPEPAQSRIDDEIPRKIIKLDKKDPASMSQSSLNSRLKTDKARSEFDEQTDNFRHKKKKLSDKQKVHNNNILRILNTSTPDQLVDLPRIGFKTAVSMYQYRLINGDFQSLRSLKKIPIWTEKICEMFFAANNIVLK